MMEGRKHIFFAESMAPREKYLYELEYFLPLLEQRGRAILNAAPVRQNLSEELLAYFPVDKRRKTSRTLDQGLQITFDYAGIDRR